MWSRLAFLSIALFWVVMNFLLWRAEYGGHNHLGGAVPVEVVWRKILTAPDDSSLVILHHGRKAGECSWAATIVEQAPAGRALGDDAPVEEAVGFPATGNLEGQVTAAEPAKRLLFSVNLTLTTNRDWQELNARVNAQRNLVAVHALAAEQTVHLRVEDEGDKFEREIRLADLTNPPALAQALDLPLLSALPGAEGFSGEIRREAALSRD